MASFAFAEFELDPASYSLRRRGHPLELQPKVLELLAYLVVHRERVVGKQELLSVLWPAVHVSEASLAWCVSQARKALGQSRGSRGPIETVHRRGYRFGAPVTLVDVERPGESAAPAAVAPVTVAADAGTPGSSDAPFVGREPAMQVLRQALARARVEGRGGGCLLLGEAGIGKTKCAEVLVAEARASGGTTAWVGRCIGEEMPPLWPWIQIVRESLRHDPDGPLADDARSLLAALAPHAGATLDPEFTNGRSDGFWVVDRVVRFLVRSAEATARLVVVDDLQWADRQSLRVLDLLGPELEQHRLLIVATLRDTDEPMDPSATRSLERLRRVFKSVALSGLRPGEVREYLEGATGRTLSVETAGDVHARTGGNPLFVQEIARRLVEDRGPVGGADLGSLVHAPVLVRARLERRDPGLLGVLEAASVLGETFDLPVLAAMLGRAPDAVVAILDDAIKARLVVGRSAETSYAFVHALVRDAILAGIPTASRCALHLRAGEALESRDDGGDHLARLALHFHHALPAGAHVKAARYSEAAAQEAARVFAHEVARAHWRHALEALDFQPEGDPEARCRVLIGWAASDKQLGRRTDSRERLKKAIALAKTHGCASQLVAAARVLRHSLLSHINIDPLARGALAEALPALGEDRERATALGLLGAVHAGAPSSDEARDASERSLALARPMGGQPLLEALWSRTFALTGPDEIEQALEVAGEMLRIDASLGRSWWSGEAHYAAFGAHSFVGDVRARDRALDDLGRVARYCRLPEASWHHDRIRAQLALQAGAFDEAERAWKHLSERDDLANLGYVQALHALYTAAIRLERTGAPAARLELWGLLARWHPGPRTDLHLVEYLIDSGRRDEARETFERFARRGFAALPRDRSFLACLATLAVVAIALDDRDRATELEAILRPYASYDTTDLLVTSLGSVAHYLGLLAAYRGDFERAREDLGRALEDNRARGLRPRAERTQQALERLS